MNNHKRPSRVISIPSAQSVIFETFWDYLAFALGVIFGSFAFGFAMKVYIFGF